MLKQGDKVVVRCKLGYQKEDRDNHGIFRGHVNQNASKIEVHGEFFIVPRRRLTKFQEVSDEEKEQYAQATFDSLLEACKKACEKLLPKEFYEPIEVEGNGTEWMIHFCNTAVSIGVGIAERKSIGETRQLPGWEISTYKTVPASQWQPEDVDVIPLYCESNPYSVAQELVKILFAFHVDSYFDREADDAMAELALREQEEEKARQ